MAGVSGRGNQTNVEMPVGAPDDQELDGVGALAGEDRSTCLVDERSELLFVV